MWVLRSGECSAEEDKGRTQAGSSGVFARGKAWAHGGLRLLQKGGTAEFFCRPRETSVFPRWPSPHPGSRLRIVRLVWWRTISTNARPEQGREAPAPGDGNGAPTRPWVG
jgi:hypothetical protein